MKNRLKHLICGACLLAFLSAPAMAQQRIATIDVQKAFDNYWKKKEAEATLKDQQADMQKDLKQMVDDIKKETDAYQKLVSDASDPAVTSEERDRRKKLAEDKLRDLQDLKDRASTYNRTASNNLEEKMNRVRESIIADIKNIAVAKAKEKGFALVLDSAAQSINKTPVVLYSDTSMDITEDVIKQLNASAPTQASQGTENKK